MSLSKKTDDDEIVDELKANFSVVYSIIANLVEDLSRQDFLTSYVFISENIKTVISYLNSGLQEIINQAKKFEKTCIGSPLQIASYRANPEVIFEYRDSVRKWVDTIRQITGGLYINVGKTLAGYIIAYETLEKFGSRNPFVLVESNEFSSQNLKEFIFGEFGYLGKTNFETCNAYVITYSGIDISNPLSLLVIGHETFHIIDRLDYVFDSFCEDRKFQKNERSLEAFVDVMSYLYFGPVYTYAMHKHFEKRYPLSGASHPEMNVRLSALLYLQSVLGIGQTVANEEALKRFISTLGRRMDESTRKNAEADKKQLDSMIDKRVVEYIEKYFEGKNISPYSKFVNEVEKREFREDVEKVDREKIGNLIRNRIPVAARPTTLLNALYESDDIDKTDSRLIVSSVKKWYVKRYYQKSIEGQGKSTN